MPRSIWTVVVVALSVCCVWGIPDEAVAAGGGRVVAFDRLTGQVDRGRLTVDYVVDRADWRRLHRRGVTPDLTLWIAGDADQSARFRYSHKLRKRRGSLAYPRRVEIRRDQSLYFQMHGYDKAWRIEEIQVGSRRANALEFVVHRGRLVSARRARDGRADQDRHRSDHDRHRGDHDHRGSHDDRQHDHRGRHDHRRRPDQDAAWRVEVVEACNEVAFSSRVPDCITKASALDPRWAAATVRACDDAVMSTNIGECLDAAHGQRFDPSATLKACEDAFGIASYTLKCVREMKSFRTRPSPAIAACSEATVGYSSAVGCLQESASYRVAPAAVIAACDQAVVASSKLAACLETARGLGRSAAATVNACEGTRAIACIESASTSR